MRRYGSSTPGVVVPGQNAGVKLALQPIPPVVEVVCRTAIEGVYWFSDESGKIDSVAEAAFLLPEGESAAGPVLSIAGLVGETCGKPVTWTTRWIPDDGDMFPDTSPATYEDGVILIVYPTEDTQPGILEVSATCDFVTYGPIDLAILRYSCYYYCPPCPPCGCTPEPAVSWWDATADLGITTLQLTYNDITEGPTGPWYAKVGGTLCPECTISWSAWDVRNSNAITPETSPYAGWLMDFSYVGDEVVVTTYQTDAIQVHIEFTATVTCDAGSFPVVATFKIVP